MQSRSHSDTVALQSRRVTHSSGMPDPGHRGAGGFPGYPGVPRVPAPCPCPVSQPCALVPCPCPVSQPCKHWWLKPVTAEQRGDICPSSMCHAGPCRAMLCHAMPCCAMPHHAVPCRGHPGLPGQWVQTGGASDRDRPEPPLRRSQEPIYMQMSLLIKDKRRNEQKTPNTRAECFLHRCFSKLLMRHQQLFS